MTFVGTIQFNRANTEARRPERKHRGDAGYDLFISRTCTIAPGAWEDVHTDLSIEMPPGVWGEIVGRSSTFRKRGIQIQHGIIDNGYRGELFIACWNTTDSEIVLEAGERIAQFIPHQLSEMVWVEVESLKDHSRGDAGFGSTGI